MSDADLTSEELRAEVVRLRARLAAAEGDRGADQYRSVVDNLVDGVITIDSQGVIQSLNPAAERIFGYGVREAVGHNVSLLMPEPERSEHDQYLTRYHTTGERRVIGIGREVMGRRQDGTVFPVELSVGEFVSGGARMFTGVVRDISARLQGEADLRQSEARFRSLFQTVGSVIVLLSPEGHILEWNGEAERLYGWQRDEVLGQDYLDLCIPRESRASVAEAFERVLQGRPARGFENPVLGRDGKQRLMVWNVDRMATTSGVAVGVIACGQDIGERRHLEAQLLQAQKMESIGQLAGGVAHDFNNQLGIILFDVDMLLSAAPPDSQLRDDLQKIRKVVLRSADLTRQLLVFSRRQQIEFQPVDLNGHIRELQRMLGRILDADVELVLSLSEDGCAVNADPGSIDQIILNLCLNACDAMPGGGRLRLETRNVLVGEDYCRQHSRAVPGRFCRLVVEDTGAGMEEVIVERIFEPFFTTKETGKGTGLGLSVVYGIVEAHHGWLAVHSQPGEGSRFEIFLPSLEEEADAEAEATDRHSRPDRMGRGEHILIVEDEIELRDRTERLLARSGYRVSVGGSLAEARATFDDNPSRVDLVMCGQVLPDGRGSDLVTELLSRDPSIDVLIVTGYQDELQQWERAHGSVHAVLRKPFAISDLLHQLREILDH